MKYAIIEDGIVVNLTVANTPININWTSIDDLPVQIGDTYNNGVFYHDGEKVITTEIKLINKIKELSEYAEATRILLGGN